MAVELPFGSELMAVELPFGSELMAVELRKFVKLE